MKHIVISLLLAVGLCGCSSNNQDGPDTPDAPDAPGEVTTTHPRLLMPAGGEQDIKSAIQRFPDLNKAHKRIMDFSRQYLGKEVVEYDVTGKRLLEISQEALKRIFYLSYAYRMTGDETFARRAETEMKAVCAFPDWNPSHFLDASEMTMAVSIGYDWLYDWLGEDTRSMLRNAIMTKGIKQADNTSYSWFYNSTSNWNSVCNAGMVYGALVTYEYNTTKCKAVIDKALETNVKALEVYGPDGGYPEGHSYWTYGASFEVMMLAALESAMGTDFGLSQTQGFKESASYMQYMECPSGQSFNYSDCTTAVDVNPALFWFAHKFDDPSIVSLEMEKIAGESIRWSDGRLLPILLIYGSKLRLGNLQPPVENFWYSGGKTPVFVYRTWDKGAGAVYLGVKGGSASTDHAHMDAGSFVYEIKGLRWACDLQRQNYNSLESQGVDLFNMKQNSPRWDLLRDGNLGHSTLTINDAKHLVSGKAEITEVYKRSDCKGATVDLTPVLADQIEEAIRTIYLDGNDNLIVEDHLQALPGKDAKVRWQMMTASSATIIDSHTVKLSLGTEKLTLTVESGGQPITLHVWDNTPPNNVEEDNPGTCRVGFETVIAAGEQADLKVVISN